MVTELREKSLIQLVFIGLTLIVTYLMLMSNPKVSTFVTAFHEAVFLYALALNETIAEGFSSTNGSLITRKMWNKTYSGEYIR